MRDLQIEEFVEGGRDCGQGNLLGIQPSLTAEDYATEQALFTRLEGYLAEARRRGWLTERTVVVWPEYIGSWLAVAGEGPAVFRAPTLADGMRGLALAHLLPFAGQALRAREKDRMAAGLFRTKARRMAAAYQEVFSTLAARASVTMVAGSIVLPSPEVRNGVIRAGDGPLYNVSAVFGPAVGECAIGGSPEGGAYPALAAKIYLISSELPFVTPAPLQTLPVFETPAGRLGVLICADSWYPAPYARLKALGAELIAVPSYTEGDGSWDRPWAGYDGGPAPVDVDLRDVGTLSEGQAWRKYALAGRMAGSGARHGINVFLRGGMWELGSDGRSLATSASECGEVSETQGNGAALLNLWLSLP